MTDFILVSFFIVFSLYLALGIFIIKGVVRGVDAYI